MPAPLGLHIDTDKVQGEVHVKTAYIKGGKGFAVKVATGFYGNTLLGLPNSSGMVLYLDSQTGQVQVIFADNGYLTDLRTALAGAVAAKHLALAQPLIVALVVGTADTSQVATEGDSPGSGSPAGICFWPECVSNRRVHQ